MQHRHLHPDEIDLLVDDGGGVDTIPLRAHVDACADCRARLAEMSHVTSALDHLPRYAPTPTFPHRVLAQVQVVEPWHVALVSAALRFVPTSRPMRVIMAASAGAIAVGISSAVVWLSFRTDDALYLAGLANHRLRAALLAGLDAGARAVFGSGAADLLGASSPTALAIGAAILIVAAGSAMLGLRALATASRRARE